jgi:amphi-Trp domain-containing protein
MAEKQGRDVEKVYSVPQFAAKLRRLADALEQREPFTIQVAGERIRVPGGAENSVEHERGEDSEELEFQLRWSLDDPEDEDDLDDEDDDDLDEDEDFDEDDEDDFDEDDDDEED